MTVVTKSGPEHTFSAINKEEHEAIDAFLKGKKVRVKNQIVEDLAVAALDDDEDEEMQSVASSGEEAPRPRVGGDDDDSEEGGSIAQCSINEICNLTTQSQSRRGLPSFVNRRRLALIRIRVGW